MEKTTKWIIGIIVLILLGVFILPKLELFSVVENSQIGPDDIYLYGYSIMPVLGTTPDGECGYYSWFFDLGYVANEMSSINIKGTEFKFITRSVFRPSRLTSECGVILYKIDIYRSGTLIDTIDPTDAQSRITSQDNCAVPINTEIIRAYSIDGIIYKQIAKDFAVTSEVIDLPGDKTGIIVKFGRNVFRDGAVIRCRNNHMVAEIIPRIPDIISLDYNSKKIEASTIKLNLKINSPDVYLARIQLYQDTGVTQIKIYDNDFSLIVGDNIKDISIPVSSTLTSITLIPKITIYSSTSTIQNLNGDDIFDDDIAPVESSAHIRYKLKTFSYPPVTITSSACNTNADIDCNNIVSFQELTTYANQWVAGTVTFTNLIQAATAWTAG